MRQSDARGSRTGTTLVNDAYGRTPPPQAYDVGSGSAERVAFAAAAGSAQVDAPYNGGRVRQSDSGRPTAA